eukprot:TRINITY_DN20897_c0_g1_i1.p2 TRINITY_DN20897_c0_g1~~TRINITY_DN20897_c0_g1_i1.p2  ORF type:complete len:278 (+),score=93.50 TRINITY_DN20897_c0_g1_i1:87-836(+)
MPSALAAFAPRPIPLGRLVFDPSFILSQIVVMQALYYLFLGFFLFIAAVVFKRELALDQFFSAQVLTLHTVHGAVTMLCHFLTVLPGAWALLCVVERSKRCLDFAITVHVVHMLLCWAFRSFPVTFEWWALCVINVTTMTLAGEYLCVRRELREIPLQNPDERHMQQSQLVRQKQEQMQQGAAGPAPPPLGAGRPSAPPPPLWPGGAAGPAATAPRDTPAAPAGALSSVIAAFSALRPFSYSRVPQGKE